jgi:hypothetical protein
MNHISSVVTSASLASFRRGNVEASQSHELPAVFVLEPHMWRTAGVIASWRPAAVVQTMGATSSTTPSLARGDIERAVSELGAASIVLCAEGTVSPAHARGASRLLELRAALAEDPVEGSRLRARSIPIEALWFDSSEGDVYRWDPTTRSYQLLSDQGLERFLSNVRAAATRASLPA